MPRPRGGIGDEFAPVSRAATPSSRDGRCLPDPVRQQRLVELVFLVDVKVAHILVLDSTGGNESSAAPRKKASFTYSA
jgi:hypothetical protein